MARTHELKTNSAYFEQVWAGDKTFEIRYDDRGYQYGDTVVLLECDWGAYTGRQVVAKIGTVLASTPARGRREGFNGHGYVVFSLLDVLDGGDDV